MVWREPDVSLPEALVRVDGKISVPLVGEVDVIGLTPTELKDALVEKFSNYIKSPSVSVYTRQINSRKIYVLGNVKKEGPVPLLRPMTVLQAISDGRGSALAAAMALSMASVSVSPLATFWTCQP